MSSLYQNPEIFICILYLVTICSDSASYFLEMSILIILVGTLTQIRMGLGCIKFPDIGPRSGQYVFLNVNAFSNVKYCYEFFSLLFS